MNNKIPPLENIILRSYLFVFMYI